MSQTLCIKSYTIDVLPGCDASVDWLNAPGTCRLRIKNFNPADWAASVLCFDARLGVVNPWDGTFTELVPIVIPTPGFQYQPDMVAFETLGGVYLGVAGGMSITFDAAGPFWNLDISYMTNAMVTSGRWSGTLLGTSPLGIYPVSLSCNPGLPATIEIEGYSP